MHETVRRMYRYCGCQDNPPTAHRTLHQSTHNIIIYSTWGLAMMSELSCLKAQRKIQTNLIYDCSGQEDSSVLAQVLNHWSIRWFWVA